tara:strand:- start:15 stop:197 length:183 start_codon:yes stop_codon:yes gene_type:complete
MIPRILEGNYLEGGFRLSSARKSAKKYRSPSYYIKGGKKKSKRRNRSRSRKNKSRRKTKK